MNWFNRFRSKQTPSENETKASHPVSHAKSDDKQESTQLASIKYRHPKILLLDMNESVVDAFSDKGFNAVAGSVGTPYAVEPQNAFYPLDTKHDLPHDYKEFEIVIIDLHYQLETNRHDFPSVDQRLDQWLVNHEDGYVNPRLLLGSFLRTDFDRIVNTGGVFIIFANRRERQTFYWGRMYAGKVSSSSDDIYGNYEFLTVTKHVNYLQFGDDHGAAISLASSLPKDNLLASFLSKYLDGARYECTVTAGVRRLGHSEQADKWFPLLENKFGDSVGGLLLPNTTRNGLVFIFPGIQEQSKFVIEFMETVLPTISPQLFPDFAQTTWDSSPEYELSRVGDLRGQIVDIREKASTQIDKLEGLIKEEKEQNSYLFDLARATGDDLVAAVQKSLAVLGFSKVIDVDEQLAEQGVRQKREDLQIHDRSPVLIVEVKGIGSYPSDDEALTVQKYVVLRMKEWDRTDVQGLTILNHQRNLPPLDRDNGMPFRQEILDAAEEQEIGLLTGWDLHRLVRSYLKNRWRHTHVRDLFYRSGRLEIVPAHYVYVGRIERYIEKMGVVGIQLETSIRRGDRIAFELPVVFEEQVCESLQFNNETIEEAEPGMLVGVKTHLTKEQAVQRVRVFKIVEE